MKIKTLGKNYSRELKDHRDNTMTELIKCYTASQISFMDGIDITAVKKSGKYLPVRVDNYYNQFYYKEGRTKRPYAKYYIRLDEIKFIFNKRTGKKLIIDHEI